MPIVDLILPRDALPRPALEALASDLSQALLGWLLAKSKAMLPIPGTSKLEHLEENVAAAKLQFSPEELRRIG